MTDPRSLSLDGEIRDGRHVFAVRVYYEDTDFTGIVYHANYLRFMERGRTNYLRLLGADHRALFEAAEQEAPGFAFVVRSMDIDFRKPARMDDLLHVITAPQEVQRRVGDRASAGDARPTSFWSRRTSASPSSPAAGRGRSRNRCASP